MLGTSEFLRLEQVPKACPPKILDGLVRDAARLIGRRCPLAQDQRQRPRLLLQAPGDVGIGMSFAQLWHDGASPPALLTPESMSRRGNSTTPAHTIVSCFRR